MIERSNFAVVDAHRSKDGYEDEDATLALLGEHH
jgi:hypothetical protein